MKKRLFSVLLILSMMLVLFPATAFAEVQGSLTITVSGFKVGKTPADCKVNFASTIPGVTFSEDDIQHCHWNKYSSNNGFHPINDDEAFQADTRYSYVVNLDNKGLTEAPTVTVNGKTPEICVIATRNGVPIQLQIECELGTPAPAAADTDTVTTDGGSKDISVNAKYVDGVTTPDVISADIEWGAMEFTYSAGGVKVWDAQNHQYTVNDTTGGWSENGNTVKVTNHSNVDVEATFTYAAESGNTLTGAFTYDNSKTVDSTGAISLAKGIEGQVKAADYVTATLKLSGTPSSTMTDFTKVGTVTVKITK